jgi:hypothetical protein
MCRPTRWVAALLSASIALCVPTGVLAQGGPPMITDDPGTPGNGNWEINLAVTRRHGDFGSEYELPLLDVNYGLGDHVQLKYEVPFVWIRDREGGSRSGVGNPLFGLKVRFVDSGPRGWQVSTYPQVQTHSFASSSERRGLAENRTALFLPFEFARPMGAFSTNFEVGREFRSRAPDKWAGGFVLGHEWKSRVEGLAEVRLRSTDRFERSAVAMNVGARVGVRDVGVLLASAGRDLHNRLDERASLFAYLGWQTRR